MIKSPKKYLEGRGRFSRVAPLYAAPLHHIHASDGTSVPKVRRRVQVLAVATERAQRLASVNVKHKHVVVVGDSALGAPTWRGSGGVKTKVHKHPPTTHNITC